MISSTDTRPASFQLYSFDVIVAYRTHECCQFVDDVEGEIHDVKIEKTVEGFDFLKSQNKQTKNSSPNRILPSTYI
jgi:hypothetical protein